MWLFLQYRRDLRMGQTQNLVSKNLYNFSRHNVSHLVPGKGKLLHPSLYVKACVKYLLGCGSWDDALLLCPWGLRVPHFPGQESSHFQAITYSLGWRGRKATCNFSCWSCSFYVGRLNINCPEDKHYSLDAHQGRGHPCFISASHYYLSSSGAGTGKQVSFLCFSPLIQVSAQSL